MALVRVLRQVAATGGLLFATIPLPQLHLWPLPYPFISYTPRSDPYPMA